MKDRRVRKALILGIIISFIGASVVPSISGAADNMITHTLVKTFVATDKNILYVGGPGGDNYTSIQDAIDAASNGDTVFVFDNSSPYYENIIVDKTIDLIGEDKQTTVIDGSGYGIVVDITVDLVNISGFTIQNSGGSSSDVGLCIESDYNTISDCNISSNNMDGILLDLSSDNTISDNTISLNGDDAIELYDSSHNVISNNIINLNDMDGIVLDLSSDNTISDNTLSLNGDDAIVLYDSNHNFISNNIISFNDDCGLIIYYPSNNNIVTVNTIRSNNEYGIYINASNNYIYHNNFIHNLQNADDEGGNVWDNGYPSGGNFWSDYVGVDNFNGPNQNKPGSDGIGDTPYEIPSEHGTDNYPFIEQHGWLNEPPDSPTISGRTSGNTGTEYYYKFFSYDPDGEDIYFWIEWGDGDVEEWIGPYEPNEVEILNHTWDTDGPYIIKAKAKDMSNAESGFTEFPIEMPRNRLSYNSLFQRLFEHLQELFPILQLLFQ